MFYVILRVRVLSLKWSYLCRTVVVIMEQNYRIWVTNQLFLMMFVLRGVRDWGDVWGIPMDTHSYLWAPMCNSIPIFDKLCRRNCNFINSSVIAFWLGPLPCTVFISVEYRHHWGAMLSYVVSVLTSVYRIFLHCHLSLL